MNTEERNAVIQGMRDCADWLAAHPEIDHFGGECSIHTTGKSDVEVAAIVKAMGSVTKSHSGEDIFIRGKFGGFKVWAHVNRAVVCERKVVGTKTIPAQIIPEQTVEVVEWECGSILEKAEAAS